MSFECEGIGLVRRALTQMAASPVTNKKSTLPRKVVMALYTEIRAARLAGHSWESIRKSIVENMKLAISAQTVKKHFIILDYKYASETGVSPVEPSSERTVSNKRRGRPHKGN